MLILLSQFSGLIPEYFFEGIGQKWGMGFSPDIKYREENNLIMLNKKVGFHSSMDFNPAKYGIIQAHDY